jgi:UDP-2,3-diacylglucosamine pyrophosphatase LpxH
MKAADAKAYRTIWISDIHLGARASQAGRLLDFIKHHESEQLYLVGDVFDGWALKRRWHWSQAYNDVVQKILRRARKGCKITYVPGNHDSFVREYDGLKLGGIVIRKQAIHTTVDGRRLLVLHGDEFDGVVASARWLSELGSVAYEFVLRLNHVFNFVRRKLGYDYWSLSAWLKHQVKNAVNHIDRFERVLADEACRNKCDGVVCGHIHRAAIRELGQITYYNTGDWVESCTALVEHFDGSMEIVTWQPELPDEPDEKPLSAHPRFADQLELRKQPAALV